MCVERSVDNSGVGASSWVKCPCSPWGKGGKRERVRGKEKGKVVVKTEGNRDLWPTSLSMIRVITSRVEARRGKRWNYEKKCP